VEHDVVIVHDGEYVTHTRHDLAISVDREVAQQLRVDLWMTEDHTHFLRLATYREPAGARTRDP
jgi:hypothetical protein